MIPRNYRQTGDPISVNYDFYDFAEGVGVKLFYGSAYEDNAGSGHWLLTTDTSLLSGRIYDASPGTYNYDLTAFNSPRTIKGTAVFSCAIHDDGSGIGHSAVKIQKVHNGVATDCSSLISGAVCTGHAMQQIEIPLTQTNFAVGDKLRLVAVFSKTNEHTHDPAGRNGNLLTNALTNPEISTKLRLYIPFAIDN